MAQALDRQIMESLPLLADGEKQSLLSVIKSFLQLKKEVAWVPSSAEIRQYNLDLDEALQRVSEGDFLTQQEVENEAKDW